jgi:ankyrin repeat protein
MRTCAALLLALAVAPLSVSAQSIHEAAQQGDIQTVRDLLAEDPSLANSTDDRSSTPLHLAARYGHAELAGLFLEAGAEVDPRNHANETPLHWAAVQSHREVVVLLLQYEADTEARENYGRTPLLLVARETGDADVAAVLIEGGADVNGQDRYGATPLNLAAWRGFGDVIDLLIDEGAEVPTTGEDARELTMFAAEQGLKRLFAVLAEGGADLGLRNDNGGSLLHSASEGGSKQIVEILLESGLDCDERDRYGLTPLHYAAEKGRKEAVESLIAGGAELDVRSVSGFTPLNFAEAYERDEVSDLLLAHGADGAAPAFPVLEGPYLGQAPPGAEPALFAAEIVSSHRFEHGTVAFSPDGSEAFWASSYPITTTGYGRGMMMTSKLENGRWTPPRKAAFSELGNGDDVPFFAPDGNRLFFISSRPLEPNGSQERIWYMDKTESGWSEAKPIDGGPNTLNLHWQFTVAANGNLYFGSGDAGGFGMGDIYVSRFVDGEYVAPENLGGVVNGDTPEFAPYIAPDESYVMFVSYGRDDGIGGPDLYISFRDRDGSWETPINLGEPVNTTSSEICPMVTHDGEYFFFNSFKSGNADNYWIDATVIEGLRPVGRE